MSTVITSSTQRLNSSNFLVKPFCVFLDIIVIHRSEAFTMTGATVVCSGDVLPGDDLRGQDQFSPAEQWNAKMGLWGIWKWTRDPSTLPDWSWQGLTDRGAGTGGCRLNSGQLCAWMTHSGSANYDSSSLKFHRESSSDWRSECRSYRAISVGVVNSWGSVQRFKWLVAIGTCHKNVHWLMHFFYYVLFLLSFVF